MQFIHAKVRAVKAALLLNGDGTPEESGSVSEPITED